MEKPISKLHSESNKQIIDQSIGKSVYNAIVISIDDEFGSGRIKAKITGLDSKFNNDNVPWSYPLIPIMFHILPKVGEVVKIIIEDTKYPYNMRYWVGSVISQYQNIRFDSAYTALSNTPIGILTPDKSIYKNPTAKDVFPEKEDIAIIGRVNTDIVLKENNILIRAGKHLNDDVTMYNEKNPSIIQVGFNKNTKNNEMFSSVTTFSDKIGLIAHQGNPRYNSRNLTETELEKIYETAHPMVRGDLLVAALNVIRNSIIQHIHGYSNKVADKNSIIKMLEEINFETLLQKNIVIN